MIDISTKKEYHSHIENWKKGTIHMILKPLKLKDIQAKIPIIQGGMGIGIGLSNLAGSVAKEGGIGIISAAHPGYQEDIGPKQYLPTTLKALTENIEKAREIAEGNGIIGVNIMRAAQDYEALVARCVENNVDLIISGAGLPMELPQLLKGSNTKFAPIVSSKKAIKVLFQMWERRYQRVSDMVVIEGPKAGGHLGFGKDQLDYYKNHSEDYDKEVLEIVNYVRSFEEKYGKIPVIFAGGVFDQNDIKHYINLGCDGVQMATRFVATFECDASFEFKNAYINAKEEDIQIMDSPVGLPGRAIKTPFLQEFQQGKEFPIKKCHQCIKKCSLTKVPFCITEALVHAVKGNVNQALLFAGENVYKVDKLVSVHDLMEELVY